MVYKTDNIGGSFCAHKHDTSHGEYICIKNNFDNYHSVSKREDGCELELTITLLLTIVR